MGRRLHLALFVTIILYLPGQIAFAIGKVPVIYIESEGLSPLQIGVEVGKQSKRLFSDIERRYDKHLATLFSQQQFATIKAKQLPVMLQQLDEHYHRELMGVADAWNTVSESVLGDGLLSLEEYQVLNFLPDLGVPPNGSGFGAFGSSAANDLTTVGRNLDWQSTPELRGLQAITVYQSADSALVNIGFVGIISVLSGFNDNGVFLGLFNAAPYSPYRSNLPSHEYSHSSSFDLRTALAEHTSIQSAARFLRYRRYHVDSTLLMVDTRAVQILEHPAGKNAHVREWNSRLRHDKPWKHKQRIALVDCHWLSSLANNCKDPSDMVRWDKLQALAGLAPEQTVSQKIVSTMLLNTDNKRYEVFNAKTLQSMTYMPASHQLFLYTRPVVPLEGAAIQMYSYPSLIAPKGDTAMQKLWGNIEGLWLVWLLLAVLTGGIVWLRRTQSLRE